MKVGQAEDHKDYCQKNSPETHHRHVIAIHDHTAGNSRCQFHKGFRRYLCPAMAAVSFKGARKTAGSSPALPGHACSGQAVERPATTDSPERSRPAAQSAKLPRQQPRMNVIVRMYIVISGLMCSILILLYLFAKDPL